MVQSNKFDKKKYLSIYKKSNYKQFKVDITITEMESLNELLNKHNLTKAQFLRNAIEELRKK